LEEVVLALLQVDKVRQEIALLQVFHLTLPQFVVEVVEVVDLQEHVQELMVDQVVVDLQQVVNQHQIILEQVFVDKETLVGAVLMLRLLV
tara:strand:- start:314 stop:583 length:270 start_codon:yes stop_codon:yes gene_type:complete